MSSLLDLSHIHFSRPDSGATNKAKTFIPHGVKFKLNHKVEDEERTDRLKCLPNSNAVDPHFFHSPCPPCITERCKILENLHQFHSFTFFLVIWWFNFSFKTVNSIGFHHRAIVYNIISSKHFNLPEPSLI